MLGQLARASGRRVEVGVAVAVVDGSVYTVPMVASAQLILATAMSG